MENGSGSPDFILADYLVGCLSAFDKAVTARSNWYGHASLMSKNAAPSTTEIEKGIP